MISYLEILCLFNDLYVFSVINVKKNYKNNDEKNYVDRYIQYILK